jgi:hypothetical protein
MVTPQPTLSMTIPLLMALAEILPERVVILAKPPVALVVAIVAAASTVVKRGQLPCREYIHKPSLTSSTSHNKADCPNPAVPREFTGTCRLCEMVGHRAADCPTAPPKVCNNCAQEGRHAIVLAFTILTE